MASTRFSFVPYQVTSKGSPLEYGVLEGGAGSNAGAKRIGTVRWDGVTQTWTFYTYMAAGQKEINCPSGSADAAQISAFIATLAAVSPNQIGV